MEDEPTATSKTNMNPSNSDLSSPADNGAEQSGSNAGNTSPASESPASENPATATSTAAPTNPQEQQQQYQQEAKPAAPTKAVKASKTIRQTSSFSDKMNSSNNGSKSVNFAKKDTVHTGTGDSASVRSAGTKASRRATILPKREPKMKSDEEQRRKDIEMLNRSGVFLPWKKSYKAWWGFSVLMSIITVFFETYAIAFEPAGNITGSSSTFGWVIFSIFVLDILINFNLAYDNENEKLVIDRREIAAHYGKGYFWIDFIGVFPFYIIALEIAGEMGNDNDLTRYLSLLRLLRLVRLHRVKQLFDNLQYNTQVSLMWLTLFRNFVVSMTWAHCAACVMYFIARQYDYDDDLTWIGGEVYNQLGYERYVTAMYWSIVTFTTVGYGDFSPVNSAEQIFGMIYMMANMIIAAYIVGSMTLLIVKTDEETSQFRDTIQIIDMYSKLHGFDRRFRKRLQTQAKLFFNNRQIADEEVLKYLPVSTRRKVLRKLYLGCAMQTKLLRNVIQQFVDSYLTNCVVEVFSEGEEIILRGTVNNDLYLLVEGTVTVIDSCGTEETKVVNEDYNASENNTLNYQGSIADSQTQSGVGGRHMKLGPGQFINDVAFFTETTENNTIVTKTVCKTLTLSQSAYKMIAADHPGSIGRILSNLLRKVQDRNAETANADFNLKTRLEILRAGSAYDVNVSRVSVSEFSQVSGAEESGGGLDDQSIDLHQAIQSIQAEAAVVACEDVIKMHIEKMKDDHTTRFLSAAARNCTATLTLMCDQGFDPNASDYDRRTALMVAAQEGHMEACKKLIDYHASVNAIDRRGTSALYEAARNGHDAIMELFMEHGAKLCMKEPAAASLLCQTVFDGDTLLLSRLLKANIQVNAADYDGRTAAHIASSEVNLVALKTLVQHGADLSARDRWGNTPMDDAIKVKASRVIEYLESVEKTT